MYAVYALYNKQADRIYIGQTKDLEQRVHQHNLKKGRHFTAQFQGKWELIYTESVATRSEALKREKQLKSFRGRQFITSYIPG